MKYGEVKYSERAERVLIQARKAACCRGNHYIGTGHILLALIQEGEGEAFSALCELGVSSEQIIAKLNYLLGKPLRVTVEPQKEQNGRN